MLQIFFDDAHLFDDIAKLFFFDDVTKLLRRHYNCYDAIAMASLRAICKDVPIDIMGGTALVHMLPFSIRGHRCHNAITILR